jgi:hypothetical protein
MSDVGRDPAVSLGSHGPPVAYGVFYADGKLHSCWDTKAKAEDTAFTMRKFDHLGVYVSPLNRQPTLTDEEREALEWAEDASNTKRAAAIRGLLKRLG